MGAGPTHCLKLYYVPLPWFNLAALEDALYQIVDLARPFLEPLGYFFMEINIDEKDNCVSIYLSKLRTPTIPAPVILAIIAAIGVVAAIIGAIFIGGKVLDYMTQKTATEAWQTTAEMYKWLVEHGLSPTEAQEVIATISETTPAAAGTSAGTGTVIPPEITNLVYAVLAVAIIGTVVSLIPRKG